MKKSQFRRPKKSDHFSCYIVENGHDDITGEGEMDKNKNDHFSNKNGHFTGKNGQKKGLIQALIEETKSTVENDQKIPKKCSELEGGRKEGGGQIPLKIPYSRLKR